MASCRIWRTARSFWWAPPPRTRRFELNAALLSRAQVIVLDRLTPADLERLAQRAEQDLGRALPLTGLRARRCSTWPMATAARF
jgi:hypothetical protein